MYFGRIENFAYGEINERSFSNPHPWFNPIDYSSQRPCKEWIHINSLCAGTTGPRLNIKTVLSTYGDFHVKDKTAVRTSYL